MTSLSELGRFARLRWLLDLGVMCLFVGGYLAAAGAMFWSFTQAPERPGQAIQQTALDAPPEMICECTLEPAPDSVN